jgi:hypothetical protein
VWSVGSGDFVETIDLEESGVTAVDRLTDKTFIVAFDDGNIGIADVTQREDVLQMNASHISTIFAPGIFTGDASTIQTAATDGRICRPSSGWGRSAIGIAACW